MTEAIAIIWSVGMRPRAELAYNAGIDIGPTGGIQTDAHMRTSTQDIFACGDCAETRDTGSGDPILSMFWHSAAHQGTVAGLNSLGIPSEYPGSSSQMIIELPGLFAGAVGNTAASKGASAIITERRSLKEYHGLIIDGEIIVGAQSIKNLSYLGPLQSAIRQGVRFPQIRNDFTNNRRWQQSVFWPLYLWRMLG